MDSIGLWQIANDGPTRLTLAPLDREKHLEDWIERDPTLLERGLVIVARQLRLEGGPLDLLALEPPGRRAGIHRRGYLAVAVLRSPAHD